MDEKTLQTAPKKLHFPRVREAREALQAKALKWAELYDKAIEAALKRGEVEVAVEALQWAMEHMPAEEGVTLVDPGVDRPRPSEGATGPVIKIGFALGGLGPQAALPPAPVEVIDVTPNVNEVEEDVDRTRNTSERQTKRSSRSPVPVPDEDVSGN